MSRISNFSPKRLQIDKANARIVVATAIASFLVVFSLVASKALLSQQSYQSRVIGAKQKAVKQLKDNVSATKSLVGSYSAFVQTPQNVIGGNPTGTGDKDGDNAKIILDALPSKYDFPAMATSLEKLLADRNYSILNITGTDDEINQQKTSTTTALAPVPMPFQLSVGGSFDSMQALVTTFEHSIRPIQIQKISLTASSGNGMTAAIDAKTYYQPEKTLTITTKDIK